MLGNLSQANIYLLWTVCCKPRQCICNRNNKRSGGASYAYCDEDGNCYRSGFGLRY